MAPLSDRYELPSYRRQAPRLTLARPGAAGGPVDPRTVAAFMAGAIFDPSRGVSAPDGDGNRTWTSQATAGTVIRTHGSTHPPIPGTASNGAPVWTFTGANGSLHYGVGGDTGVDESVRFGAQGCIAGLFKAGANTTGIHTMINMWSGNAVNDRVDITTGVSGTPNLMVVNGSDDGTSTAGAGAHRWKFNGQGIDYTLWHAFIWWFDFINGVNYDNGAGGNYSTKLVVYDNGSLVDSSTSYSAPPAPFSSPPAGPVVGPGLFTGPSRFNIGGSYVSVPWWTAAGTWQVGAVLVANGLDGLTPALVHRCLMSNAPA